MEKIKPSSRLFLLGFIIYILGTITAFYIRFVISNDSSTEVLTNVGRLMFLWFALSGLTDALYTLGRISEIDNRIMHLTSFLLAIINLIFIAIPILIIAISFENFVILLLIVFIPHLPVIFYNLKYFNKN